MSSSSFHLNERAVARIAEAAAQGVPGTVALDSKLAGLAGRGLPRVEARIDHVASAAAVDVELAVSYPSPVVAVTDAVRAAVIAQVEALTGLSVVRVNVTVADARAEGAESADQGAHGRVTAEQVQRHPVGIDPRPIEVPALGVTSPATRPAAPLAEIRVSPSSRTVAHPSAPAPTPVRVAGFLPDPVSPRPVAAPEPATPRSPHTPPPVRLAPLAVPEPARLAPVVVKPAPRVPVKVSPSPVRSVSAPEPAPLSQISINPVVNYHDLSR
ncbi:Asp23/Gls24 family envelope stress response protein [uncultured Corynebacterium sp.]|uniref:Asp23/Gls24 family envelope stress response protein n=1 Tax=uncultured Corynebacterium sp. TaxID=159447 RepID=UPI002594CDDE|nr:Asp23/Gls24 family envelope stress response protein [uncultured Corynebacterium sp.]